MKQSLFDRLAPRRVALYLVASGIGLEVVLLAVGTAAGASGQLLALVVLAAGVYLIVAAVALLWLIGRYESEQSEHRSQLQQARAKLDLGADERDRQSRTLRDSETRYNLILDSMMEGCQIISHDWRYLYLNDAALAHGKRTRQELLHHTMMEMYPGIEQTEMFATLQEVMAARISRRIENRFVYEDESVGYFELSIQPIEQGLFIISTDITERKNADLALRESEERYSKAFNQSPLAIAVTDLEDQTIREVNDPLLKMMGYTRDELIGQNALRLNLKFDPTIRAEVMQELQAKGSYQNKQVQLGLENGDKRDVLVSGAQIEMNGRPHALTLFNDITQHKRTENLLHEAQQLAETTLNALPAQICVIGNDGTLLSVNDRWREFAADNPPVPGDFYLGANYLEVCDKAQGPYSEGAAEFAAGLRAMLRGDTTSFVMEYPCHAPWEERWFLARVTRLPGQTSVRLVVAHLDISERKRAEIALRYQAELLDQVSDAIISTDAQSCVRSWNPAAVRMYGWTEQEALGKRLADLLKTEFEGTTRQASFADVTQKGYWKGEVTQTGKHGQRLTVLASVVQTRDADGNPSGLVAINRDITERKVAEQALLRSEHLLQLFVEYAPAAIAMLDRQMRYIAASRRFYADYRLPRSDVVGLSHYEIFPEIPARWKEIHRRALAGEIQKSPEDPFPRDDGTVDWVRWEIHPWYETPDKIGGILLFSELINERKQAELERDRRINDQVILYEAANELRSHSELMPLLTTILDRAIRLLRTVGGGLYLAAPESGELAIVAARDPILRRGTYQTLQASPIGQVVATRQSLIAVAPDALTANDPDAVGTSLQVPLLNRGELIGVLAVTEPPGSRRTFSADDEQLLSLFATHAATTLHNARLLDEARTRVNQLAALYDAGLALNRMLEPDVQLQFLFEIATKALHADRAEYFRYDPLQRDLRFEMGVGHPDAILETLRARVLPADDEGEIAGWVAQNLVPLTVPDVRLEARWRGQSDVEIRSGLWVPVEHEGQLLGVLGVLSNLTETFKAQDERLLVLFANQAAVALANTQLFRTIQRHAANLEAINRVSGALRASHSVEEMLPLLLAETSQIFAARGASLWVYDTKAKDLVPVFTQGWQPEQRLTFRPGQELIEHIYTQNVPFATHDFQEETLLAQAGGAHSPLMTTAMGAPLRTQEGVIGVMLVFVNGRSESAQADLRLLTTLAEIAGTALQRTQLYELTARRIKQLQALQKIDRGINASLDMRISLDILLEQTLEQLQVHAADVLLFNPFSQMLEYTAGRGFRSHPVSRSRVRLGQGSAGRAALERRTIVQRDLRSAQDAHSRAGLLLEEQFVLLISVPLVAKATLLGVLEVFHREPFQPDDDWFNFLETLAGQAAIAIDSLKSFEGLQRSNIELSLAYDETIEGWSRALDLRDHETEGHTQRVTELTTSLARVFGLSDQELVQVRRGALLHDIGKMGIPDEILLKPGKLTDEEWVTMRKHPQYALELLTPIAFLRPALDIPYAHHEKWDGTGYPRGLQGEHIPFAARIFAIVDVWDALRSDRPYRKGWSSVKTAEHIRGLVGTHFDPAVAEAFFRLEEIREAILSETGEN